MQSTPEKHLYEYAVIRYVPRVEREEFFNVGLIMMCKRKKWIEMRFTIPIERWEAFDNLIGLDELKLQLESMRRIAMGESGREGLGAYPVEERFRWITAVKSSCVQTSRPHPGMTENLKETFEKIYEEQIV